MSNTNRTKPYQPIIRIEPIRHRATYQRPRESHTPLWVMLWVAVAILAFGVAGHAFMAAI